MRELTLTQYRKEFYPTLCPNTIRGWIVRGVLSARKTPTGRWLISVPDSDAANDAEFNHNAAKLLDMMNGG